ncbi:MAG: hypothetical protein H6706_20015 [Myxococcales bacterium]|nr:hypothetical protein [Myxococcales bacterium]
MRGVVAWGAGLLSLACNRSDLLEKPACGEGQAAVVEGSAFCVYPGQDDVECPPELPFLVVFAGAAFCAIEEAPPTPLLGAALAELADVDFGVVDGDAGGAGGAGGGGEASWVVLVDVSPDEENRTPGSDICGVSAVCADGAVVPQTAILVAGAGTFCSEVGPGCTAVRDDAVAALDDGALCRGGSAPSDYVSMGIGGSLAVDFGRALAGCTVAVVELAASRVEAYEILICETSDGMGCQGPIAVAPMGGTTTVMVP